MRLHILGICGTFMGGLALLARALGHEVSGSDTNVYPPMSTQLAEQGISLLEGDDPGHLRPEPDLVIIGNAYSRGQPQVEHVLNSGLRYCSGPQWLSEQVLQQRWVLAVSGTHGKTTTTALLSWLLEDAGLQPGFLIGGVAENFGLSARLGEAPFFVIEADEYDTAFFDKRSKFVHYRPRTLIINNIEFDHADIFPDLAAIQRQFHHLLRTVPGMGQVIHPVADPAVAEVLEMGCWSECQGFSAGGEADWSVRPLNEDYSRLAFFHQGQAIAEVEWPLIGRHNAGNALAAVAAACHAGVPAARACESLAGFLSVKRRLEKLGEPRGISLYDDFAHHPTAIRSTLEALRQRVGQAPIRAILEPRSNTMRMGVHGRTLAQALQGADQVLLYRPPGLDWDPGETLADLDDRIQVYDRVTDIIADLQQQARPGDHLLVMSNGGFEGLPQRLLQALSD